MRLLPILLAAATLLGCAANAAVAPASQPQVAEAEAAPAPAPTPQPATAPEPAQAQTAPAKPGPLPESMQAGNISRADLTTVLEEGVGRFLQKLSMEAHRPRGRFEGWLLQSIFDGQPNWQQGCVLRPGDVVVRINNQSVERPEQFMAVWQSLASAGEIAIDVKRGGKGSRVRYLIVD